jgi:hypothetical protein
LNLESAKSNLADCFIQLIKLVVSINKISTEKRMIGFKNHCIKIINERWKSFDIKPYLLAYYLHPLYRGKHNLNKNLKIKKKNKLIFLYLGAGLKSAIWSDIATYAGELFYHMSKKNHSNDKVAFMIGQMANFKCGETYYSTKYSSSYIKPKTWWQMVDDPTDYLKSLALKLFSIIPHSAACERSFSMLSFLYGKRRQCLSISTIEMIAKIRSYLISNIKNELNHLTNEESESELKILIQECGFYDDDEDDDSNDEDDDIFDDDSEIPSHEVYVLVVNNMIDLNNSIFTGDFEEEVHDNSSDDDDELLDNDEELDFEVIAKISAPLNM